MTFKKILKYCKKPNGKQLYFGGLNLKATTDMIEKWEKFIRFCFARDGYKYLSSREISVPERYNQKSLSLVSKM